MLFQLFHLHQEIPFFNIFRYITFRAIYATVTSMLLLLVLGPWLIRWLRRVQVGQEVRDDGPKSHLSKQGTPTMGGVLILLGIFVSTLLWADLSDRYVWMVLISLGVNGTIGFLDDYLKVVRKKSKGLLAWQKFSLQIVTGVLLVLWYLYVSNGDTRIVVPFLKVLNPALGLFFLPFAVGVLAGTANAVNLTDGLDGLAIGPVIVVSLAFMGITYVTGHHLFARYLEILHVPGAGELAIVCGAMVGSSLGFLWFNSYPASIFMGDVGSLALGGGIGMMAIITRQELLLVVLGGIFVAEAVSVIAQVLSFKIRKKRVLRMAPLHHHYELGGLEEPKVIVRFWIVSIILALISLSTFKLR